MIQPLIVTTANGRRILLGAGWVVQEGTAGTARVCTGERYIELAEPFDSIAQVAQGQHVLSDDELVAHVEALKVREEAARVRRLESMRRTRPLSASSALSALSARAVRGDGE